MSIRQPKLKDQARVLREAFSRKGTELGSAEAHELVAKLNGYPSWNVAKQADKARGSKPSGTEPESPTILVFEIWTATHAHRHGQDLYFFTSCPSMDDAIEAVQAASSYEPEDGECIEIGGVERFEIDVPLEMAKAAQKAMPAPLTAIYEVNMTDYFQYENPEEVPAWKWVQSVSSFSHQGNGVEAGVWEFMVHTDKLREGLTSVPEDLLSEVHRALELNASWMMFHQG